jgi:hypothetical protein
MKDLRCLLGWHDWWPCDVRKEFPVPTGSDGRHLLALWAHKMRVSIKGIKCERCGRIE